MFCDNVSNIKKAKKLVFHAKTKHTKCHYHFMQEKVMSKEIAMLNIPSIQQVDIFTQSLHNTKLEAIYGRPLK
jgi:hypothetical protein